MDYIRAVLLLIFNWAIGSVKEGSLTNILSYLPTIVISKSLPVQPIITNKIHLSLLNYLKINK